MEKSPQQGHVLLVLFWNRNTQNRRYSCSFRTNSVFGMNNAAIQSALDCTMYRTPLTQKKRNYVLTRRFSI